MIKRALLIPIYFILSQLSLFADITWETSYKEALRKAKLEQKDVFAYFTGSDWCSICRVMSKEVFDKKDFTNEVQKKFILLKVDFLKKKPLPEVKQRINDTLARDYSVEGFPTIILMDDSGRAFAKTGYTGDNAEKYWLHITELLKTKQKRDGFLKEAKSLKGVEKARALGKALQAIGDAPKKYYDPIVEEILKADPQDESGYKKNVILKQKLAELEANVINLTEQKKNKEAQSLIDIFLEEYKPSGTDRQKAMLYRIYTYEKDSINFDQVEKYLDSIIEIDPKSEPAADAKGVKKQVNELRNAQKK